MEPLRTGDFRGRILLEVLMLVTPRNAFLLEVYWVNHIYIPPSLRIFGGEHYRNNNNNNNNNASSLALALEGLCGTH